MQRVTVTLDDELVAELERYMKGRGYDNRSEAIRDLARAGMQQANGDTSNTGEYIAALVYVRPSVHVGVRRLDYATRRRLLKCSDHLL